MKSGCSASAVLVLAAESAKNGCKEANTSPDVNTGLSKDVRFNARLSN